MLGELVCCSLMRTFVRGVVFVKIIIKNVSKLPVQNFGLIDISEQLLTKVESR